MVMPSDPATHLVMIQPDFAFGFFKDGFNGPTHTTHAHQLNQWSFCWGVAEVVLNHFRVIKIAADDKTEFTGGQVCTRFNQAQEGKVTDDGTFAAFFDFGACPAFCRESLHQVFDLDWMIGWNAQTQTGRAATVATPFRNVDFGTNNPNRGHIFDLAEIPLPQISDSIAKSGRISI